MQRGIRNLVGLLAVSFSAGMHAQPTSDPFDITRTSSFTYFASGPQRGLLQSETIEPDLPQQCVTTTHGYDAYGNKNLATTRNCAGAGGLAAFVDRSSGSSFESQTVSVNGVSVAVSAGTFATRSVNALLHAETREFDPRFGAVTRLTGPNGLDTRFTVDAFGRLVRELRADGTSTEIEHCLIIGRVSDPSSNTAGCGSTGALSNLSTEIPALAVSYVQTVIKDARDAPMAGRVRVYKDRAGRTLRELIEVEMNAAPQPANRRWIVKDTEYSATGVAVVKTQPYFLESGSSTLTGSNDHGLEVVTVDALGRPVQVDVADPAGNVVGVTLHGRSRVWARTTFKYDALTVTITNPKNHVRIEEKNVEGRVVRITDAHGAQLAQQHDAVGNLVRTKDAMQNVVRLTYDVRGRKLSMNDPDTGLWRYDYNALGELVWQQSPNERASQTQTKMAYDRLGRMTERVTPEYTSRWHYDRDAAGALCGKSVGKLCESVTSHGVTKKLRYDALGRPFWNRTIVSGGPSFERWLQYSGIDGRVTRQFYPTGLAVDYVYTGYGALQQVRLANAVTLNPLPATVGGTPAARQSWAAGRVLWTAGSYTAWGKPVNSTLGNGVQTRAEHDAATGRLLAASAGPGTSNAAMDHAYAWDTLNNLTGRVDRIGDGLTGAVSEGFTYDDLSRLTKYVVDAPAIPGLRREVALRYDAIGNLRFKSDVGTYTYPQSGASDVPLRPHAVSSVSGPGFGTINYTYDANGNAMGASGDSRALKWRSIAYTSFNLPDSQLGIAGAAGMPRSTWQYDENHQRIRETRTSAAGTRTTWYQHPDNQGGLAFESEVAPGGALSQRHYVRAGAQTLVLVSTAALPTLGAPVAAPPTPAALTLVKAEWWLKDHLGSVVATLDHSGAVTARYAYDPFGKRRQASGTYDAFGTLVVDWSGQLNHGTDRGFTGHEHLDDLGLVHMNGRLYDPTIGRFLQADPFIQAPDELQNYNRYSYCHNNGLNCVDPSGYIFKWLARKWREEIWRTTIGRAIVSIAVAWLVGPGGGADFLFGVGTKTLTSAAIAGFAGGAVATGNLEGALQGAFTAGIFHGVGTFISTEGIQLAGSVALHAVAGCVTSVVGGSKCGPGALAAGFSKFATPLSFGNELADAIKSAVVGGLASKLGGGKFENGAITGAFGYLFNQAMHGARAAGGPGAMAARAEANDALALRIEKFFGGLWDSISYSWTYRERALLALGIDPASEAAKQFEVHHIVQKGHSGSAIAVANLASVGIGVHDLENLLVLKAGDHRPIHTDAYRTAVNLATAAAVPGGHQAMSNTLNAIKVKLITTGTFP